MSFGWSFGVFWMVNFRFSIGVLAGVLGSFLDAAMYWFMVVCIDLGLVLGVLVVAGVLVILWPLVGEFWISVKFNIGVLVGGVLVSGWFLVGEFWFWFRFWLLLRTLCSFALFVLWFLVGEFWFGFWLLLCTLCSFALFVLGVLVGWFWFRFSILLCTLCSFG